MPVMLAWLLAAVAAAGPVEAPRLRTAALAGDWQAVQAMGRGALPELVRLYTQSPPQERATIAQVAIQALGILTRQTKGFQPNGSEPARSAAVEAWKRWLAEYRANL